MKKKHILKDHTTYQQLINITNNRVCEITNNTSGKCTLQTFLLLFQLYTPISYETTQKAKTVPFFLCSAFPILKIKYTGLKRTKYKE